MKKTWMLLLLVALLLSACGGGGGGGGGTVTIDPTATPAADSVAGCAERVSAECATITTDAATCAEMVRLTCGEEVQP